MSRSAVGLDLGSTSVKVARVRVHPQSGLQEVEYCEERMLPAPPTDSDTPKEESLRQRQARVVRQLHEQGLLSADELVSALSGIDAHTRTIPLPFADRRKIESVLAGELESYLPMGIEDLLLSWTLQPSHLLKQPSDKQTQHPVAVAFAKRDALRQHLEFLKELQVDPRYTTLQSAALAGFHHILLQQGFHADGSDAVTHVATDKPDERRNEPDEHNSPCHPFAKPQDKPDERSHTLSSGTNNPTCHPDERSEEGSLHMSKRVEILRTPPDDKRDTQASKGAPHKVPERSEDTLWGKSKAPQGPMLMVDMGHASTKMCALQGTHILSTRCILRGGRDASLCLARINEISLEQAESDKREGETLTPQAIQTVLQEAYGPIAREIHQTVLALHRQTGKGVRAVIVTGGASRMVGLQDFLTHRLDVPVRLLVHAPDASLPQPQFATAIGQAAYALHEATRATLFNFRKGEFAWRGEFVYLRERARPLTAWGAVFVGLLFVYSTSRAFIHRKEISDLQRQRDSLCKQVLRRGFTSGDKCLQQMQQTIAGAGVNAIPQTSATDVYLELAQAIPAQISVQFSKLDITDQTVRLDAVSKSFEDIDQIVTALAKRPPFAKVERGRAAQTQDGVRFQLKIDLPGAGASAKKRSSARR